MRHPTEGVLRRLVDEPAGVAEPDRRHVADCPVCLTGLAEARADAAAVSGMLATGRTADVDVTAGWQRLSTSLHTAVPVEAAVLRRPSLRRPSLRRPSLRRPSLRRPAVAALAFATVLTGAGVAAANDWLPIFRTEQVASLELSTDDLVALPDLTSYGDVEATGTDEPHPVADAAAASEATGLTVPEVVALPAGVTGDPTYQVVGELSAVFTFSAEKAAAAAAATGEPIPPVPAGLDGSRVRLAAGPGVAEVWTRDSGMPIMIVGRAVAPTASSSGASFAAVRDYLLSLPGLPDDLAAQLRSITGDGSTLPLPVPADRVETSTAEVDGVQATVLTSRDQLLAAVVWVEDGILTAVAGPLDTDEVLSVARELR